MSEGVKCHCGAMPEMATWSKAPDEVVHRLECPKCGPKPGAEWYRSEMFAIRDWEKTDFAKGSYLIVTDEERLDDDAEDTAGLAIQVPA